jgi:multidrug efflux pump subunit AcrB
MKECGGMLDRLTFGGLVVILAIFVVDIGIMIESWISRLAPSHSNVCPAFSRVRPCFWKKMVFLPP